MYNNRDTQIEFCEHEVELKNYFGDTVVCLNDILDAITNLLIENENLTDRVNSLENELNECYSGSNNIDYYEEYGLNETDFH